jgi:hypothetical protein
VNRRFFTGVAVLAVVAGGTTAAVTAAQPAHHARAAHPGPLAAAAGYLGVTNAELRSELRSGRSLAQIAAATPGKSRAALIEAMLAAGRSRLAAALAELPTRVGSLVDRVPGTGSHAAPPALRYLGIKPRALRQELRSGRTLGQIADATPGRSAAGLIEALVAARTARLQAAVAAGKLTPAQESRRLAHLRRRVTAAVNASRPVGRGG